MVLEGEVAVAASPYEGAAHHMVSSLDVAGSPCMASACADSSDKDNSEEEEPVRGQLGALVGVPVAPRLRLGFLLDLLLQRLVFAAEAYCYAEMAVEKRVDCVGELRRADQHLGVLQAFVAFVAVARFEVDRGWRLVRSYIVVDGPIAFGRQCSYRHCRFHMPNSANRVLEEVPR